MNIFSKTLALLVLIGSHLSAFDGFISKYRFTNNEVVIHAETTFVEESVYGQIIKISDYDEDRPYWIPDGKSVKLDTKTVENYFFLEQIIPSNQSNLYQNNPKPSKEEIAEAEKKDGIEKANTIEKMNRELTSKGLNTSSKDEFIIYFYSGKAKMKVLDSLKGELKSEDLIEVQWEKITLRISCPPILPFKGKGGWVLNKSGKSDNLYKLAHGFTSWEEAIKVSKDQTNENKPK